MQGSLWFVYVSPLTALGTDSKNRLRHIGPPRDSEKHCISIKEIYGCSLIFFAGKRLENLLKCDDCPRNRRKMVRTKHCCWGECKTDSRYREKWPKSLKEVEESGRKSSLHFRSHPKISRSAEGG